MSGDARWRAALRALDRSAWPAFLDEHSGLPGPRANTALAAAFATAADIAQVDELLTSGDEYRTMCAAAALGFRADEPATAARARSLAADGRWRVREGVAMGLQLLGDDAPGSLVTLARTWAQDADPLVQRAAVAAVCEPRLLRTAAAAAAALAVCAQLTDRLVAVPAARRRDPALRTLRQALGYCWSVAVAADPTAGLPVFRALDASDPDVGWIVRENLRKKRLAALL